MKAAERRLKSKLLDPAPTTPEAERVAEAPQAGSHHEISSASSEVLACWFRLQR